MMDNQADAQRDGLAMGWMQWGRYEGELAGGLTELVQDA